MWWSTCYIDILISQNWVEWICAYKQMAKPVALQ